MDIMVSKVEGGGLSRYFEVILLLGCRREELHPSSGARGSLGNDEEAAKLAERERVIYTKPADGSHTFVSSAAAVV